MSGICGIAFRDRGARVEDAVLTDMLRAIDVGWAAGSEEFRSGQVSLGVQGSSGETAAIARKQSEGRTLALVFHGKLYEPLKPDEPGSVPGSGCEGLLELYLKEGGSFVDRLRGDYAFALWDGRVEALYLATDRFRVHPLFYAADGDKIVFASRLKSILASGVRPSMTVNPECIVDVVASSAIPTPKTIYREIQKLPPGHLLRYAEGRVALTQYWDIDFRNPLSASVRDLERETKTRFREGLEIRLTADGGAGRVGAFLSGGVDSSVVTAVLTQLAGAPVKTFSIGFGESSFNEIGYARVTARAFGSDHHEYFVTPEDTVEALDILIRHFDEPYANSSAVPAYYCARLAREHGVKVLYAGDAGDELFAGNPWYATQRLFDYYHRIPAGPREAVLRPAFELLARAVKLDVLEKGRKYILRAGIPNPERMTSYGFFNVIPMVELFEGAFVEEVGRRYDPNSALYGYYRRAPADDDLDRRLYIDLKLIISDNDILKVVRMTHAAGVGVRFPFLDHRFAEFAARVPAPVKMRGTHLRSFFKKAYSDVLPAEVLKKKKHGFGLPIPIWLRTHVKLNEIMHDLVLSPRTLQRGYFKKSALEEIVRRHRTDETSFYGTLLWHLMMVELWMRSYPSEHR